MIQMILVSQCVEEEIEIRMKEAWVIRSVKIEGKRDYLNQI